MSFITRGFSGRRGDRDPRLPPGQTLVSDWPVLSAGPTPEVDTADWAFVVRTENGSHTWSWDELRALGIEDITTDIHCVTHWTKLEMPWRGVPLDRIWESVETEHEFVMAHSYGGYTTNVPLEDLLDGKSWIAFEADGEHDSGRRARRRDRVRAGRGVPVGRGEPHVEVLARGVAGPAVHIELEAGRVGRLAVRRGDGGDVPGRRGMLPHTG